MLKRSTPGTLGGIFGGRNVIAENGTGVQIESIGSGNLVQGNYIGTIAAGTAGLANATGVDIFGSNKP